MVVSENNRYPVPTPTLWQMVILRNVGLVKNTLLAKTLKCSLSTLKDEIKRLGLEKITYSPLFLSKSYITIIRNNWNILPNEQIISLLETNKEEFEFNLKENDFLSVKLGYKPSCQPVYYVPLNESQKQETNKIKKIIHKYFIDNYKKPFDFVYPRFSYLPSNNTTIVYPYSAPFGDALLETFDLVNDKELKAMHDVGVNGVWFQGLLSKLAPYPFDGNDSQDYQIRLNNLNKFIKKAKSYGIGVYLYLNEPRSIKESKLADRYKHLIGRKENDEVALCISQKEVQDYLYESTKFLLENATELSGIITITSSENLTHCQHTLGSDCPKCKSYRPYELAALINNLIQKAIDDSHSKCRLLANLWGWAPYCGFTSEEVKKGIEMLNKKITVLSVSEFGTHINKNGPYNVGEYSISHGEPCLETIENLSYAKKMGHKIMAKIQVNNSWEMSTIAFIPTYECVIEHLQKLQKLGVKDLMASWTLGGYPGASLSLLNNYENNISYDSWLKKTYHADKDIIKEAVHLFSKAFKNFPFDINTLYFSSLHLGPLNPLFKEKSLYKASMVTFPYDDIDSWIDIKNEESVLSSFNKLLKIWHKGLKVLEKVKETPATKELKDMSQTFYVNVFSFIEQYLYYSKQIKEKEFLSHELKRVLSLYAISSKNATIGFEASNHYLYTQNLFLEKIISIKKAQYTILKEKGELYE